MYYRYAASSSCWCTHDPNLTGNFLDVSDKRKGGKPREIAIPQHAVFNIVGICSNSKVVVCRKIVVQTVACIPGTWCISRISVMNEQ